MDVLLIATTLLAVMGIVATAAGTDSRDGFAGDAGRSFGR